MKKLFLGTVLLSALTYTGCTNDSTENWNENADSADLSTLSALSTEEIAASLSTDIAMEDVAIIINDQFEAKLGSINTPTTAVPAYTSILPTTAVSSYIDTAVTSGTTTTTTRTITITFGTDTAPAVFRGRNLKGQIILNQIFTTSTTKNVTVTFNNFSINDSKIEGTGTWQRVLVAATPTVPVHPKNTFTMIEIKHSTSTGIYLRNGWIAREMIAGFSTRTNLNDDVNAVNVAYVTLNQAGYLMSAFTIATLGTPLIYNTACSLGAAPIPFAGSGTLFISKNLHSAVIKYGAGDCDNVVSLAMDINLSDYFTGPPVAYGSNLYVIVPSGTTPPTPAEVTAQVTPKFNAKFDEKAAPFTLPQ